MLRGWRGRDPLTCLDQVANAPDSSVDLTPASDARADATKAGWLPLKGGQDVPLIWERYQPEEIEPCRTR